MIAITKVRHPLMDASPFSFMMAMMNTIMIIMNTIMIIMNAKVAIMITILMHKMVI
jgi:hypothetical protein